MTQQTYIGKGSIYLDTGTSGLLPIGNCSKLSMSIDEEKKELLDYENAGGGLADSISRITAVKLAVTCHNMSPENIAIALRGGQAARTGSAISNEALTSKKGTLVTFARLQDLSLSLAVTGTGGTPTYTEGTDYERRRAGIWIPSASTIPDGAIEVDYTALADNLVQALTSAGQEYRLVFDGLNEARSGKAYVVDCFRVKFSPTSGFDLIGDDFAGFEMSADILKDTTKTGAGISQFFKAAVAQ